MNKKKYCVVALLFVVDLCGMQLIQKVYDWRDDRKMNQFMGDFGSKSCMQMTQEVCNFSCNARKKILNKAAEIYPLLPKKRELLSAAVILALLPYDMQKKILAEIDTIFTDDVMAREFLNRPFKEALCWSAYINKRMGDKQLCKFEKVRLFGQEIQYELTRVQMFNVSLDEVIMLDSIQDYGYSSKKLEIDYRCRFKKKELITLQQLIEKGHIANVDEVDRTVDIVVDTPWDYPLKLLKKSAVSIALPLFTSYCAERILVPLDPPINNQKRITNSVLEMLELSGEGPYLKHELNEQMYPSGALFKYFLIKLFDLGAFGLVHLVSPLQRARQDGFAPHIISSSGVFSLGLPFSISLVTGFVWIKSLFAVVNVSEFKRFPIAYFLVSMFLFAYDEWWEYLLTEQKDLDAIKNKTIYYTEIPQYLNNRWINIH